MGPSAHTAHFVVESLRRALALPPGAQSFEFLTNVVLLQGQHKTFLKIFFDSTVAVLSDTKQFLKSVFSTFTSL